MVVAMKNTNNNPEAATGNEVGDVVQGFPKSVVPKVNHCYTMELRLAGRLADDVVAAAGKKLDSFGDCYLAVTVSEDGGSIVLPDGKVFPLMEETVEIPTPPWVKSEYYNYDPAIHIPGWRVYKSEMMEIILAWVKGVEKFVS